MIYDWQFKERCQCSTEDKKECMAVVSTILSLGIKARHLGLLTLVKNIEETTFFLLKKGIQLIVDGVKHETVRKILEFYILTGDYRGKELIQRCLILEGVLAILDGVHPKVIKEILLSILGEDDFEGFEEQLEKLNADFMKDIQETEDSAESMLSHDILQEMLSMAMGNDMQQNSVNDPEIAQARDKLDEILSDFKKEV